jgi:hypothetical protein
MPETFIIYRKLFDEDLGLTKKWRALFRFIKNDITLWNEAKDILEENDFNNLQGKTSNKTIKTLLEYYTITREDVKKSDAEYLQLKKKFDHLIQNNQFIDLTLTYDYEERETEPQKKLA